MFPTITFIQNPLIQKFIGGIYALLLAFIAVITQNIHSLVLSICLVVFFMVGDFASGIFASRRVYKLGIESSKLRWSVAKYAVYCFFIIGTLVIGVFLHLIECFSEDVDIYTKSSLLTYTLSFIKFQMYFVSWIEAVSIVENLRSVYPQNVYLKGIHYVLVVDIRRLIPHFSSFLKEVKTKDINNLNQEDNEKETTNNP